MNEKLKNYKDRPKGYFSKVGEQARRVCSNGIKTAIDNKELVIAAIPVAIAGLQLSRSHVVSRRVKNERKHADKFVYDPSTRFHWELKRKLKNSDRVEIQRLRDLGFSTFEALEQLRLLK